MTTCRYPQRVVVEFHEDEPRPPQVVVLVEDQTNQVGWLADWAVGPFDTWQELMLQAGRAIYREFGPLNR